MDKTFSPGDTVVLLWRNNAPAKVLKRLQWSWGGDSCYYGIELIWSGRVDLAEASGMLRVARKGDRQ